jgi:hypothetical protein
MSKNLVSQRLHPLTRIAMITAALLMALNGGTIHGEEQQKNPQPDTVDTSRQLFQGPSAEEALAQLSKQIEAQEQDLAKMQKAYGPNDARVVKAKKQLENLRRLFAIQTKLNEISQEESNEVNQAEISHLRNELSKLMNKQVLAQHTDELKLQLQSMREQLEYRERQLAEMKQQFANLERERALPPLENGQVKIYTLKNANARGAASTITSLFGAQAMRVAVDDRTNSLIVFGKDDSLPVFEALLERLDSQAAPDKAGKKSVETAGGTRRSVLLRLFCLADNITDGGQSADKYLPQKVVAAVEKLGLTRPQLISQTVTSLSVSTKGAVEFSNDIPLVINGQPANLASAGKIQLADDDDERAELQMKIQMNNPGIQCAVQGSLATPLGHYMVLGTANSLTADEATMQAMAFQQGMMGPGGPTVRRGGGGRGEFGGLPRPGAFGEPGAAAPEGGAPIPGDEPAKPTFETSRFAFVVQVVNAESYAGGETKSPKAESGDEPSWEERAKGRSPSLVDPQSKE